METVQMVADLRLFLQQLALGLAAQVIPIQHNSGILELLDY
jgi:hypothetical protein